MQEGSVVVVFFYYYLHFHNQKPAGFLEPTITQYNVTVVRGKKKLENKQSRRNRVEAKVVKKKITRGKSASECPVTVACPAKHGQISNATFITFSHDNK